MSRYQKSNNPNDNIYFFDQFISSVPTAEQTLERVNKYYLPIKSRLYDLSRPDKLSMKNGLNKFAVPVLFLQEYVKEFEQSMDVVYRAQTSMHPLFYITLSDTYKNLVQKATKTNFVYMSQNEINLMQEATVKSRPSPLSMLLLATAVEGINPRYIEDQVISECFPYDSGYKLSALLIGGKARGFDTPKIERALKNLALEQVEAGVNLVDENGYFDMALSYYMTHAIKNNINVQDILAMNPALVDAYNSTVAYYKTYPNYLYADENLVAELYKPKPTPQEAVKSFIY